MKSSHAEYLLVVVTVVAAAGWLFSKNALLEFAPFSFMASRFLLAAAVLSLFCLPQLRSLKFRQLLRSASVGFVLGVTLLFWVIGLDKTTSIGESAFIVSLTVVVVPGVGRVIFLQPIPLALIFSLVPALAGLVLLTIDNGFVFEEGQGYFITVTIGFALYLNLSSHFVSSIPSLANTTVQLASVGLIAAVAAIISESWPASLGAPSWGWLLASALIATSFRFALQNHVLQSISPSHASMILLLEPIWTAIFGTLLLGENLSSNQLAGCVLIFTAILVFRAKEIIVWLRSRTRTEVEK